MRILAIGAHPDDIEFVCAGTLARFRQAGHHISMAVMANGCCGSKTRPAGEISAIREKEARAAAAILEADFYWVGYPDLEIPLDLQARRRLTEIICQAQPDLIITHPEQDYLVDHSVTGRLAQEASFCSTLPNYLGASPPLAKLPPIFHTDTLSGVDFQPTEYVDITATIKTKQRMLACHESQRTWLADLHAINMEEAMLALARLRGVQCGVEYAEGFRPLLRWGRIHPARLLP